MIGIITTLVLSQMQPVAFTPQSKSVKSKVEKIQCGENCLCTKLKPDEIKSLIDFISQQKERQANMERFRQQNPNFGQGFRNGRNVPQQKQNMPD